MRAAQMRRSIIIGAVALPISTSLAIRKEVLARRDVVADPDCADGSVHPLLMAAQLVLAVETVGVICADAAICLWSLGSPHGDLWDGGDFFRCAICGRDAQHLMRVDLGHAGVDGLDLWSNGARSLGDQFFGAARGA